MNWLPSHQHSMALCGLKDVSLFANQLSSAHVPMIWRTKMPSPPKVKSLSVTTFPDEPASTMMPAESRVSTPYQLSGYESPAPRTAQEKSFCVMRFSCASTSVAPVLEQPSAMLLLTITPQLLRSSMPFQFRASVESMIEPPATFSKRTPPPCTLSCVQPAPGSVKLSSRCTAESVTFDASLATRP